ncbi:MAG: hypothetical protein COB53_04110 [Elusimicrobia bacterium]|nr:MAG: hypothetical protein COB53_04110 [Elusimicrobiota bacterium]
MKQRIFVLDDEWDMTYLTKTLLNLKGFEVAYSNQPKEALKILKNTTFDLLFVDLMMPSISGFEIISAIRRNKIHDNMPIIVLSAKRLSDLERKEVLKYNARFLRKPISPSRLFETVEDVLKNG